MSRLFIPNLNFEEEIAGWRQKLPDAAARRMAELAACWLPVADAGDYLWCPEPIPPEFWDQMADLGLPRVQSISEIGRVPLELQLEPWGWTAAMRDFAQTVRALVDAPPLDCVRLANSRTLSLELEQTWGIGLEGSAAIRTLGELELALQDFKDRRWVLKSEFGAAARHRVFGRGNMPPPNTVGWIRRRLTSGEVLFLEPWVERIAEAGLQWMIPRTGAPVLMGITGLLTGEDGSYRGSVFGLTTAERELWQPAIPFAQRAVERLQQLGFFGPVGIDAMRYRAEGDDVRIRPLQDINARWTMGRLALGWERLWPRGTWRHGTAEEFVQRRRAEPRCLRTSPEIVGNYSSQSATWLEPRNEWHGT